MSRAVPAHVITDDSALGGSVIERSLRFNSGDSPYLTYTPSGAGSNQMTFSFWMKRGVIGTQQVIFSSGAVNARAHIYIYDDKLLVQPFNSSGANGYIETNILLRDSSAWYHIVVSLNNTSYSDMASTMNVYVNGVSATFVTHVTNTPTGGNRLNDAQAKRIGEFAPDSGSHFDGYLAEFNFVDGQVLTPSYFGYTESQTGLWRPKRYEGTYGTNGFHLDFSDNSSTTTLGIDKSPNGNDWSLNNFSVSAGEGNDSLEDTPTNTFCTLNPLERTTCTYSNGNLNFSSLGNGKGARGTFFVSSGKWYFEYTISSGTNAPSYAGVGIQRASGTLAQGKADDGYSFFGFPWKTSDDGTTTNYWANSWSFGDVIGVAFDLDNREIFLYKNGSLESGAAAFTNITAGSYAPFIGNGTTSNANHAGFLNFGQRAFIHTPPTGFKALNTKNLSPNVPSIVRPQKHFDTILYTGNNGSQTITGLEFDPDLVWAKNRQDAGYHHDLYDTVRGNNLRLFPSQTQPEATGYLQFGVTGGFSLTSGGGINQNNKNHVAWCWKAGGSAVSNTDGTITSQVSANTEAGFSIMTYQGTGYVSGKTIGHGLGKAPNMIWVKRRNISTDNWAIYFNDGTTKVSFFFNTSAAVNPAQTSYWASTDPTSSVFYIGTDSAVNGSASMEYVGYAWAEIPGYSKFGTYEGNGNSDGTYVHLGFRPAWVMVKNVDTGYSWDMFDNKRDPDNVCTQVLAANLADAEATVSTCVDFLSNGFKFRNNHNSQNRNGDTFIYMAFAEQPGTTPFDTFPNAR